MYAGNTCTGNASGGRQAGKVKGPQDSAAPEFNWGWLYEMAGMVGWSTGQLYAATWPELLFFFRGFQKANGVDPDGDNAAPALSRSEYEEMKGRLNG